MNVPIKLMVGSIFTPDDNILIGQPVYNNVDPIIHKFGIGDGNVQPRWFPGVDRFGNMYMAPNGLIKSEDKSLGNHGAGFEGSDYVIRINGTVVARLNTLGSEFKGLFKTDTDTTQLMPSDTGLAELIAPVFTNKTLIAQFNRPVFAGLRGLNKKFVVTRSPSNFVTAFGGIFVRGGTADTGGIVQVNNEGIYERVGQDIPRINHDPKSKKCLGLLIEPASTNLLVQSQNPLLWTTATGLTGTKETVNNWTSKGLNNPITFTETNTNTEHTYIQNLSANPTQQVSVSFHYQSRAFTGTRKFSLFASDDARNHLFGIDLQASSNGPPVYFANRTLGNGVLSKYLIEDIGNNIYRISITGTINPGATNAQAAVKHIFASLGDSTSGSLVFTPTNMTAWCYINDFQLEQRSTVTSYIQTAATTLSRGADVLKLDLANNFNYSNLEGLFEVSMKINLDLAVNTVLFSLQSDTGADRLDFYLVSVNTSAKTYTVGIKTYSNNALVNTNASLATVNNIRGRINYSYENISAAYTKAVFSGETGLMATISLIAYE